jgi:hypothetical protein
MPGGAGWALLDDALAGDGVAGACPALDALLEPLRAPPAWVDVSLARAGAVAFWRVGAPTLFLTLTYGALASGYQSAALVRPLAATGRLERMAARRLSETTRWALCVTAPGGMGVGAEGWEACVRVRLVHALVRRHLNASGEWDREAWGEPISGADGFATAIGGFLVVPLRCMRDLGVRFSPAEEEAVTHLWRWVAYVMGVPEHLLPVSASDARERVELALATDSGPNADSPRLMHALLYHGLALERILPGPAVAPVRMAAGQVTGGFARRWLGGDMADRLDVPGSQLARLVPLLRPAARVRDLARATGVLGDDSRLAALELALVRRVLAVGRAPAGPLDVRSADAAPVLEAA